MHQYASPTLVERLEQLLGKQIRGPKPRERPPRTGIAKVLSMLGKRGDPTPRAQSIGVSFARQTAPAQKATASDEQVAPISGAQGLSCDNYPR